MSINTFTLKAGPDGKAKFQMIIPVQYCTNELFKDISMTVTDKNNQPVPVTKTNLQFEMAANESIGEHRYRIQLKNKNESIDTREITVNVLPGEGKENKEVILRFRESLTQLSKNGMKIHATCYHEPDDLLLIGNQKNLELFNKRNWEHLDTLSGHSESITIIHYDPQSNTFLTAGNDKIIRWDMNSRSPVEVISDYKINMWSTAHDIFRYDENDYFVYSETNNSFFLACNLYDKTKKIQIDKKAGQKPSYVRYDSVYKSLLIGDGSEFAVKVFSMPENKMIQHKIMLESGKIDNITILPGNKYFMTHSENADHFKIWEYKEWKLVKRIPLRSVPNYAVTSVLIDNKSPELLIFYQSGIVDIYDWYGI